MEITICKNAILVARIYKLPNLGKTDFIASLEILLSKLSNKYEKLIVIGDFNMTTINPNLSQFLDTSALLPLSTNTTCFKNSKNPSCIDLLLTNFKPSFIKTDVFETDF